MIVAGVDGCRRGWVVALADGTDVALRVVERFDAVIALLNDGVTSIAVDMPIGLPACGPRACDVLARRALGPRRSSVFPAPPRALLSLRDNPTLDERDYPAALRMKREIDGVGLSKQAFFLLPKIAEVDAAITPARQMVVVEAHPELAFARLAGEPLNSSKRTPEGSVEREGLLASAMATVPSGSMSGTARHDLLDALALAVTARRLAKGTAERLGDGTRDERGLVMEIAW